jgi:adenylate kinase family enzyme
MPLAALGPRICIMGPSNSGKSTLALAIGTARDLPVVHLDQLHHLPGTDWQPRAPAEFHALHDAALAADRWVMDGNYSRCLPQRLARATGVILLDVPTLTSLRRYIARCWDNEGRVGALEGDRDSIKWTMLRHIAVTTRANRRRYDALAATLTLPLIRLASPRAIAAFYRDARLTPPRRGAPRAGSPSAGT